LSGLQEFCQLIDAAQNINVNIFSLADFWATSQFAAGEHDTNHRENVAPPAGSPWQIPSDPRRESFESWSNYETASVGH